jgi:hypothetical protein
MQIIRNIADYRDKKNIMKINIKQQELVDEIIKKAKVRFPEIQFKDLTTSPDDPEHIWINVITNMEDDKEMELIHFSSKLDYNILMKYGYKITLMPENPNVVYN